MITISEARQTTAMIEEENLDVRTITMGINILDCADPDEKKFCEKIYDKITAKAKNLVKVGEDISREFGVPVVNKRISVTPVAIAAAACKTSNYVEIAKTLDSAGRRSTLRLDAGSGSTPYSAMPGRTRSRYVPGKCSTPPELARCRSGIGAPMRSKCAQVSRKRSSCTAVIGDAGSSAQARCE